MLALDSVTVRYPGSAVDAVLDVSLTADRSEWMTLVGPNGAGKSSLLRAIAHLERYTGSVHVGGERTSGLSHRHLARLVAYVPQQPEMPAGMTALEYTMLGRTPHIGYFGVESAADRRQSAELLDRLGVGALAGRVLPTLSGGERQRVVLARALAQQAPVLLLDEPTSALDIGNRVEALELVDELRAEFGLTVVSVMHDLTLAAQFADRLVLLADGRIAATGSADEVLTEPVLTAVFGANVRVLPGSDGRPIVVPTRLVRAAVPVAPVPQA
jgi:iron complex transport system ATP-binding protein